MGDGVGTTNLLDSSFNQRAISTFSSSSDWPHEAQTFIHMETETSYTIENVREHNTTDGSIELSNQFWNPTDSFNPNETNDGYNASNENSVISIESGSTIEDNSVISDSSYSLYNDNYSGSNSAEESRDTYYDTEETTENANTAIYGEESDYRTDNDYYSDSHGASLQNSSSSSASEAAMEWDTTGSSAETPVWPDSPSLHVVDETISISSPLYGEDTTELPDSRNLNATSSRNSVETENPNSKAQVVRNRRWTLEECSICLEVMLTTQKITSLECSHNFHTQCILPWLYEKRRCPNCRRST